MFSLSRRNLLAFAGRRQLQQPRPEKSVSLNAVGTSSSARRAFWSAAAHPGTKGQGGLYVTKYQIVKPAKEGNEWDDFLIAMPDKDQLATHAKDANNFLRYNHFLRYILQLFCGNLL
jgi:hypothetical protein